MFQIDLLVLDSKTCRFFSSLQLSINTFANWISEILGSFFHFLTSLRPLKLLRLFALDFFPHFSKLHFLLRISSYKFLRTFYGNLSKVLYYRWSSNFKLCGHQIRWFFPSSCWKGIWFFHCWVNELKVFSGSNSSKQSWHSLSLFLQEGQAHHSNNDHNRPGIVPFCRVRRYSWDF